jgi:hypothetical protein
MLRGKINPEEKPLISFNIVTKKTLFLIGKNYAGP